MSSDVANVFIGNTANDGTGDPIRSAFDQVNKNFGNLDTRISHGNIAQIYSTVTVTGQNLVSNTSTTTQTLIVNSGSTLHGTTTADSLVVNGALSGSTITSTGNVTVGGTINSKDVIVIGNLTVHGTTTTVESVNTSVSNSLLHLHTANAAPWTVDDGKDVGFTFDYYKGAPKTAALVWANDTQALEFYANGVETSGNVFVGTYGNIKAGSFFAANNTSTAFSTPGGVTAGSAALGLVSANIITANVVTTENLTVTNKIVGSIYIGGPGSTDTIYVNGVPVATAVSSFNGGQVGNKAWFLGQLVANSTIASTSTTTGAFIVDGGVGITGNLYAGGIINTPISGSTGDFTSLTVNSTFAASSVSFLGGYITNIHGDATQWSVIDFTSGNVKITGGTITGLSNLTSTSTTITGGTITGLSNLTTSAATITSGSLTGLSQVTSTNLTSTNGLVTNGATARIAGDFSNATVSNRLLFQTTTTNGATNISAIPRGTISATVLASGFNAEDTSSALTGSGSVGSFEMYQGTEVRITSGTRGVGATYLPLAIFTNGSKSAQFSTNHDFTVFNTGGSAGVITLGSNGAAYASSFNGSLIGTIMTGAQPNITSLGTLSTLSTSGDVSVGGSLNVDGPLASLNVTTLTVKDLNVTIANNAASAAAANGAGITVNGANATITYASATDSWDFNKNVSATLRTAAQPNITSVGTLSSLAVTGNISGGALYDNGSRVVTTASLSSYGVSQIVAGTNITISPPTGTGVVTINTAAISSVDWSIITSKPAFATVATSGSYNDLSSKPTIPAAQVNADWNATSGVTAILNKPSLASGQVQTDWNATSGMGVLLNKPTFLPGAKYTESATAPVSPTAGDQWYNTASDILYQFIGTSWVDVFTAGITATSSATANTITQRDSSGGAAFTTVTASTVSVTGALTTTGVGTVNIGTSANKFGTIYGTATTAQYADLAERYASDKQYEPGTVVVFGGPAEITVNDGAYDTRIAGVVSTNPAYLMNDATDGLPIALTGRVPCKVIGPIRKGDVLVASKFPGIAQAIDNSKWVPGCVIGKALAAVEQTEITTIEVVIGRF